MAGKVGSIEHFLPVPPARARVGFDQSRSLTQSSSRLVYVRSSGTGFWRGSFKLPAQIPDQDINEDTPDYLRNRANAEQTLRFFRQRDTNSGFFFADLLMAKNASERAGGLPAPEWFAVEETTSATEIKVMCVNHPAGTPWPFSITQELEALRPGQIVSFRQAASFHTDREEHVTSRTIDKITVEEENESMDDPPHPCACITLDYPLPAGFIDETNNSLENQICWNRPHVRAVIVGSPSSSWQVGHGFIDFPGFEWIEDVGRISHSFRTEVDYVLQLEDGSMFQLEDGSALFLGNDE